MTDRSHDFQFNHLPSQQAKRPVPIALGRRTESHGNDLGLLGTIEKFLRRRYLKLLSFQRLFKPSLDEPLPDIFDRLRPTAKRLGDSLIGPRSSIRIGLKQILGTPHFLARRHFKTGM